MGRHAWPIVLNADFQGRAPQGTILGGPNTDPMAEGRGDEHLTATVAPHVGGLRGVFHEVEEDLDQLILIAGGGRQ